MSDIVIIGGRPSGLLPLMRPSITARAVTVLERRDLVGARQSRPALAARCRHGSDGGANSDDDAKPPFLNRRTGENHEPKRFRRSQIA